MVQLNGNSLTVESFHQIVLGFEPVALSEEAKKNIRDARSIVDTAIKKGDRVYSVLGQLAPSGPTRVLRLTGMLFWKKKRGAAQKLSRCPWRASAIEAHLG
jgi:hypothetical protein